jgi:hypothetical protein
MIFDGINQKDTAVRVYNNSGKACYGIYVMKQGKNHPLIAGKGTLISYNN